MIITYCLNKNWYAFFSYHNYFLGNRTDFNSVASSGFSFPAKTKLSCFLLSAESNLFFSSCISAHKHCGRVVVTASINNVSFDQPIFAGEIVSLHAKVSRAFNSSMEVFVDVFVENADGSKKKSNEAIYNFVAIDQNRNPISVDVYLAVRFV